MDATARIIDANTNRAREGARTLEDLARFVLNDPDLSGGLKRIRHDLVSAIAKLPLARGAPADARDTPGDVGTRISTGSERSRTGTVDLARAAGARLGESLRVLEETSKALGQDGASFESIRYAAYELEGAVIRRLSAVAPQWRLCVLLTSDLCLDHGPEELVMLAVAGGADCVQVREKSMDSGNLLGLARRVVEIARGSGAMVIVNDRPDIARLAGADGVHVGQSDFSVSEARRIAGQSAIVGVSTTNTAQALAAVADGASYCGCGPMFPSGTKHKPEIVGPAYLRAYLADPGLSPTPHLAIGGITPERASELGAVGCRGVAVSAAVCGSSDPGETCRRIIESLDHHAP